MTVLHVCVCVRVCGFTTGCQFFSTLCRAKTVWNKHLFDLFYFCKLILQLFSLGLVACQGGDVDRLTGTLVSPITLHFHCMVPAQLASDLLAYSTGSLQISWVSALSQQELKNIFIVGNLVLLLFKHMRGRRCIAAPKCIRSSDTLRCLDDLKLKGHGRVYATISLYRSSVLLQVTQQCLHTSVFKASYVWIVMCIMQT